jgi:DNA-binding SARP family transcriptional activator
LGTNWARDNPLFDLALNRKFVALQGGRADRRHAAGSLWPDSSEDRTSGNLRSALWRLRGAGIDVLESDKVSTYLSEWITTDLEALCEWANRLIAGTASEADLHIPEWTTTVAELLPGWYDHWVIFERERIRLRMLHALEVLSRLLPTPAATARRLTPRWTLWRSSHCGKPPIARSPRRTSPRQCN